MYGRKAYGSHRTMSDATKARNIAASIAARLAEGRAWSWDTYGIADNAAMVALVQAELTKQAAQAA